MTETAWRLTGIVFLAGAAIGAIGLVVLIWEYARRKRSARPDWSLMMVDTAYFSQAVTRIFQARGFRVARRWIMPDPIERQPRDVVLVLEKRGQMTVALCGRWVIPITSEIIGRFDEALCTVKGARNGMIVTTSEFSKAARDKARGRPLELADGATLQNWIDEHWR